MTAVFPSSQHESAVFEFSGHGSADLVVDAIYSGGTAKNIAADPISKLLPVGNSGGIRIRGTTAEPSIVALITSGQDLDWPDHLDPETGVLTYFGDNKSPGKELHRTGRGGNVVFRNLFDAAHGGPNSRADVPPILVFQKAGPGRDYRFLGLAVPGTGSTDYTNDLVGVWRSKGALRYQNYRAMFTILDVPIVPRKWINDILSGEPIGAGTPPAWRDWRRGGVLRALRAPRATEHRNKAEQQPVSNVDRDLLTAIHEHFQERPTDFEHFAADLVKMHLPDVASLDVTRRSRDGGRDAIGLYRVGVGAGGILLDFSMEAKCYAPGNSLGVRELSRLISRLRHRQFGILVTTSHLDLQAYKELKEDEHPIVVIAASDIAQIVRSAGLPIGVEWREWLAMTYPPPIDEI